MNKKKIRNLILLLAVLLLLAGVLLFLKKNEHAGFMQDNEEQQEEVTATQIPEDEITEIEIIQSDDTITLTREKDGWSFEEGSQEMVDEAKVTTFLDNLCELKADQKIDVEAAMEDYGISDASTVITLQLENDMYVFRLGDYNFMVGGYYVNVNDDKEVYLVDSSTYNLMNKDRTYFTAEQEAEN